MKINNNVKLVLKMINDHNYSAYIVGGAVRDYLLGKPIKFNPDNQIEEERKRINDYLKEEITSLAESLPVHIVVPYSNIKKKEYPKSK